MKNVTLSADEHLIEKARQRATKEGTTLNEAFREWLSRYVSQDTAPTAYRYLMNELTYAAPGKKFSRDELNAR